MEFNGHTIRDPIHSICNQLKEMTAVGAHTRNSNGITMVEVLAAMLVVSIGILALAPMMVLSITGNQFSEDITSVAAAAQLRAENMIGRGKFPSMPYSDTASAGDGAYHLTTEVKDNTVDSSIPDKVYEVTVSVVWDDETGVERNLSFITYSTKP